MAGFVKSFNQPIEYVLYDLSYANLLMYNSVLPSYDFDSDKKKKKKDKGKSYNMDDKANKHILTDLFKGRQ